MPDPRSPTPDAKPWYRQFWPWFILALPLSAVIAGITTVFIAAYEPDGLVVDDYYKQGLAINRTLARDRQAARRGLRAAVTLGAGGEVTVALGGEAGTGAGTGVETSADGRLASNRLTLLLRHPTRARQDNRTELVAGKDGAYHGHLPALAPGRWHVEVEPPEKDWRLRGRIDLPREDHVLLLPPADPATDP